MLGRILGRKIGMTQIFADDGKVVPVTVVDANGWVVTGFKTESRDGYAALQIGLLRDKYKKNSVKESYYKKKKEYFSFVREVSIAGDDLGNYKLGQKISLDQIDFGNSGLVKVSGNSKGLGFQGVVKRWGFAGGPSSHGSNFHRIPGSVGNICSQGKVVKGKKMPGRFGGSRITVSGLRVVKQDNDGGYLFIKGAVPGKKGSLLVVSKQG